MPLSYNEIFGGEYIHIPEATKQALWAWVQHGQRGGDFLDALIANDLMGVFAHADDENLLRLKLIVMWLFNRAPRICFAQRPDCPKIVTALDWPGLASLAFLTTELSYINDDDEEETVSFPAKWIPCPRCPDGTVDCFEGGVTKDMLEDPDFAEDYAAGKYSKPCPECEGERIILVPNESAMNDQQKHHYAVVQEQQRERAESRAEERRERQMEGGMY